MVIALTVDPVQIWYNPDTQLAELSSRAHSPLLTKRLLELGVEDTDMVRVVYASHAPALSRSAKPFLASVGDSVVNESNSSPFTFDPDVFVRDST